MTPASHYLLDLARLVADAYRPLPTARAGMVTGSAAKGLSDYYSDLDMTMYYEGELPDEALLQSIRQGLGGSTRKWLIGDPAEGGFAEAFDLNGIEVQIGHTTIAAWEKEMGEVLERHNPDTPLHKALEGTLHCRPLFGESYLAAWQEKIRAYPDRLAEAMVKKHLAFFPVWGLEPHFRTRDATIWLHQLLVEATHNLMGVLAGLNRLYFTTFQFKRMGYFVDQMAIKPADLPARIELIFAADLHSAVTTLEDLVAETVALVDFHMPAVDTAAARRRQGWRQKPWEPIEPERSHNRPNSAKLER